ncbi:hypothetical protein ABPG74_014586 [Tetrahymena malaccensis]
MGNKNNKNLSSSGSYNDKANTQILCEQSQICNNSQLCGSQRSANDDQGNNNNNNNDNKNPGGAEKINSQNNALERLQEEEQEKTGINKNEEISEKMNLNYSERDKDCNIITEFNHKQTSAQADKKEQQYKNDYQFSKNHKSDIGRTNNDDDDNQCYDNCKNPKMRLFEKASNQNNPPVCFLDEDKEAINKNQYDQIVKKMDLSSSESQDDCNQIQERKKKTEKNQTETQFKNHYQALKNQKLGVPQTYKYYGSNNNNDNNQFCIEMNNYQNNPLLSFQNEKEEASINQNRQIKEKMDQSHSKSEEDISQIFQSSGLVQLENHQKDFKNNKINALRKKNDDRDYLEDRLGKKPKKKICIENDNSQSNQQELFQNIVNEAINKNQKPQVDKMDQISSESEEDLDLINMCKNLKPSEDKMELEEQVICIDEEFLKQFEEKSIYTQLNQSGQNILAEENNNKLDQVVIDQIIKYQIVQQKLNKLKYVSFVITQVLSQRYRQIPENYWQAFQQSLSKDEFFKDKNARQSYQSTYVIVNIQNNIELKKEQGKIEIGLLLIGQKLNQIEYDVNLKVNFMGKFDYYVIMNENQKPQDTRHLFFAVIHEYESDYQQNKMKEVLEHNNFLVVEPDTNLYPTLITKSNKCERSALVKMAFRGSDQTNINQLKGFILQDLLEILMGRNQDGSEIDLKDLIKQILNKYLEELYLLNIKCQKIENDILIEAKNIQKFIEDYITNKKPYLEKTSNQNIQIQKHNENQMNVNNEILGIKGQIDSVLQYKVLGDQNNQNQTLLLPFEYKSGYYQIDHEFQNLFYCILLNQKYSITQNLVGIIYYSKQDELKPVFPTKQNVFRNIHIRNKFAFNIKQLKNTGKFPIKELKDVNICKNCYEKDACYAMKTVDDYTDIKDIEELGESNKDKDIQSYQNFLQNLTKEQKEYLQKWITLIMSEEKHDSEIKERNQQNLQNDLNNLLILEAVNFDTFFQIQSNQVDQALKENMTQHFQNRESSSIDTIHLQGEYQNLNEVLEVSNNCKEGDSFLLFQNDIKCKFKATLEEQIVCEKQKTINLKLKSAQKQVNFHKKKVEEVLENGSGKKLKWNVEIYNKTQYPDLKQNVLNFILKDNQNKKNQDKNKCCKVSSSIIQNCAPQFNNTEFTDAEIISIIKSQPKLRNNEDQAKSIEKILKSESLTCIQGMPGTGKTFLIAHLIKIFLELNKTVLVTSYTNSALDNIIIKVLELFPEIEKSCLRLGFDQHVIHRDAQKILYNKRSFTDEDQYKNYMEEKKIFFATTIGSNNKILNGRENLFDYCIVDEASQCVEPLCLGPMLLCEKSILIGDHQQLQPIVKSPDAANKGLSTSLFERMCKQYIDCCVKLRIQFRMNKMIMGLSNQLVYDNQLQASQEIQNRIIQINDDKFEEIKMKSLKDWILPSNQVVFINTDKFIETIVINEDSEEHLFQTKLICFLVKKFQEVGIKNNNMALITPYNFYRNQLKKNLQSMKIERENLELFTVDKSQGIERDIIIFHIPDKIGNEHLLSNIKRMNVALTRAKMKLIIVTNQQTLNQNSISEYDIIKKLMALLSKKPYEIFTLKEAEIKELQNSFHELESNQI